MTYIVSSGTLNPTIPYHTIQNSFLICSFCLPVLCKVISKNDMCIDCTYATATFLFLQLTAFILAVNTHLISYWLHAPKMHKIHI